MSSEMLEFEGEVAHLSDGLVKATHSDHTGLLLELGDSALLKGDGIDLVLVSLPMEPSDMACFELFGVDPRERQFVVLKSRVHWRAAFESMVGAVIPCAGVGACTSDYSELEFTSVRRPIFPLERDAKFNAGAVGKEFFWSRVMSTRSIFPDLNEVQHVAVIGTGLIGAGWVAQFLLYGLKTTVWDPAPDFEDRLMGQLQDVFSRLHVDQDHQARCLNALNFAENLEVAAASAQFIQENGPENLQVKRGILEELARAVPPDVVIASSASGLPMSELQQGCLHPERLVIGHPFIQFI